MVIPHCTALTRRDLLLAATACAALPATARARSRPLLTLVLPDAMQIELDEAMLAELHWHEIVTHTAWTDGPQHFRGPLLADVLSPMAGAAFDLAQRQLTMTALNDFVVELPASDAWIFHPILAREANGTPMRVRDKGPLWLVYPRDLNPALQNPVMDERWIWQLTRIEIR